VGDAAERLAELPIGRVEEGHHGRGSLHEGDDTPRAGGARATAKATQVGPEGAEHPGWPRVSKHPGWPKSGNFLPLSAGACYRFAPERMARIRGPLSAETSPRARKP